MPHRTTPGPTTKGIAAIALGLCPTLLVACGSSELPDEGPRTSLLVLTLDTTRADHLGAYGCPLELTPHLDALATRAAVFERAYTPMPQTLPAHATLFTGLDPRLHGALENAYPLAENMVTLAERFQRAGARTAAFVAALVLSAETGIGQGFETFDEPTGTDAIGKVVRRTAEGVTDAALAWAEGASPEEPFFLWAHYYDPHNPFTSPEEMRERVSKQEVRAWVESRMAEFGPTPLGLEKIVKHWHRYASEVLFMDQEIGRLLAGLEERGLLDQTTILVVGDHGEGLSEHGVWGHGIALYEEAVRVPLFLALPDARFAGVRVAAPVAIEDLYPTLLRLVLGDEQPPSVSGTDLTPLLEGTRQDSPPVFLERPHYSADRLRERAAKTLDGSERTYGVEGAIVDGTDKLLLDPAGQGSFFDLLEDPAELRPLPSTDRGDALRNLLGRWHEQTPTAPPGEQAQASPEQLEALRALGYIGDD